MGFGGGGGGFNNGGGFSGGGRGGGRGGGGGGYQQGGFGGGGGYGGGGKGGKGGYDNSRGRGRGSRGRGRQYDSWGSKGGGKGGGGGKGASATLPKNLKKLSGHTGTVTSIDVAMEKEQFFSGSADGSVKVWSWANASFENTVTVNAGGPVECVLVFYPWLFAGTTGTTSNRNGVLRVWQMESGVEQSLEGHQGGIYCLAQGGAYLFSGGEDMCIYTWQYAETGFAPLIKLEGPQSAVQRMTTVEGQEGAPGVLVSAHRGGQIHMWDLTSGAPTTHINTGHTNALCSIILEGTYLFTGALDGHVKVWDGAGGQLFDQVITNQQNAPSGVTAMLVVSEGESSVLVTACDDKALKMWVLPTFDKRGIIGARVGHSDVVRCLAKGPGNSFFSGGMDGNIMVWEFMS